MTALNECTICLLDYNEETKTETECNHIFHQECLDKWLETNNTSCPLCRTELKKDTLCRPIYALPSEQGVTLRRRENAPELRRYQRMIIDYLLSQSHPEMLHSGSNVAYRNPEELDEVWALLDSISATTDSISATAAAAEDNSSDEEDEYTRIYGSHIRVNFD